MHRCADLAHRAFDFWMAGMPDQDQLAAAAGIALALVVNLRDQRTGRIENRQAARLRILDHGLRHTMGTEHGHRTVGNFVQFLDEARTLVLQRVDDVLVVHDLMADIDGLAELLERPLDDVDRANDAGAESAGLGENDSHRDSSLLGPLWPEGVAIASICVRRNRHKNTTPRLAFGPFGG